ncbi:MAG: hypothetical protein IJZ29_00420, partial [Clostridia bacterium]|nr:hypothetical protein [Clostridia bacterium]
MVYIEVNNGLIRTFGRLWALFSTISYNLEKDGWGTRYPVTIINFCDYGIVNVEDLEKFSQELEEIHEELKKLKLTDIVLDYNDLTNRLNFDKDPELKNVGLLEYFKKNSEDADLIEYLKIAIEFATRANCPIKIVTNDCPYAIIVGEYIFEDDGKIVEFLATIKHKLENETNAKYPTILNKFALNSQVDPEDLNSFENELKALESEFKKLKVKDLHFSLEDK